MNMKLDEREDRASIKRGEFMDSGDETPPEAGISPPLPPSLHGKRSNTCIWLKLFIRRSDTHTHGMPHPERHTRRLDVWLTAHIVHATVGPFTTKDTLASFFHFAALVPFSFFLIIPLSFCCTKKEASVYSRSRWSTHPIRKSTETRRLWV